jgi:hypothetical protein
MNEFNNIPRRGRRPIDPPWYLQAATLVANGTPLRQALGQLGIQLTERELQNVYRHVRFRQYLDEGRVNRWQVRCYQPGFPGAEGLEVSRNSGNDGNGGDGKSGNDENDHNGNGANGGNFSDGAGEKKREVPTSD